MPNSTTQLITWIVILVVAFFGLIAFFVFARYFRLWIQSVTTGARIGIFDLLGMTFRKVNPTVIVRSKIMAVQAGLTDEMGITSKSLEAHYLAGGNVPLVIRSIIAARKAKTINLDFKLATAIDLAGRNVLEAVQTSVYPKVIDCPARGSARESLDAVAKNGIQLKVQARVTVRANLNQLIGGATEETIIARVGEGIVSAIGSSDSHTQVLENPDRISKAVLARRLDSQTAFEIVSIDIADIDVGDNIGARLQADQAEADTRVARANAEGRRAMAVSQEQEMIAQIEEMRAKVVEAEAEIPKAIAAAFRDGNLSLMDYYKLRNVQADTDMRKAIAGTSATKAEYLPKGKKIMVVNAPLLAANDWLGIIVPIVFFIIYALNQLLANKNPKAGQRPPQRREPQAERPMRPNPNAPPAANPPAPRAQGGKPTPLDAEIEQFLRRADQRRGNRPQQKRTAQQQQPPKAPPKSAPRSLSREADSSGPIAAEALGDRGFGSVAASVEQHMGSRGFAQRAEHLSDDMARGNQQMEEHLQKSFNRKVGTLDSTTQGRSATPLTDTAAQADTGPQSQASALAELLSNAQGVRQAMILSEILERPEHRW